MNLDELHKVMKGDMTVDQACEGMTDDFEIGHVSHRADGDYRKVAQGQWKKVTAKEFMDKARADSAAGWKDDIEKKKEQIKSMEKRRDEHPENAKGWQEEIDRTNKEIGDIEKRIANAEGAKPAEQKGAEGWKEHSPDPFTKFWEKGSMRIEQKRGKDGAPEYKAWNTSTGEIGSERFKTLEEAVKHAEQKGEPKESGPEKIDGMSDRWTIKSGIDSAGNMRYTLYDNGQERSSSLNKDDVVQMAKWQEEIEEKYSKKKEPKAEGGKRQLKRRADGTIIYETPDDVIYDMVENYNELDRGDLQGVIEAAAMSHGWDENEILEEVDRQATEKYNLGVDSAPPRLTRDTKIRLSRIKREQTQDRRYRIGEISEKTGLQKTANGWREVKKGGAPKGGKAEVNPVTGKPLRPETVAYAKQKKAEAEQKRNTEKTAGGFTLAQNDKIKNAALDVITKRRGEQLTAKNLKRDYKMSDEEANETVRRVNEYFENLQKDRKELSKK